MKLLYITNGINGAGGLERVLSIKVSYLADHYGYKVTILSLNETIHQPFYEFSSKINFKSISVGGNPVKYINAYRERLQIIVDEVMPDIISVCDDGLKGFFIPQFLKSTAKIIYERHVSKLIEAREGQGFLKTLLTKAKWSLMENLATKFSKFIVLTEGNRNEWHSLQNIEVIPNPLSFYPEESSNLDTKTVICVGKISFQKGQDLLVEAWERVWEKHPDWKLELYGYPNEQFLNTKNFKEKNIFVFPPEKKIIEKYLNSSIYVMSSRFEGFGMVLIEAMACGVPCVSFNCNYGPSDIIDNENDGILVENGNILELSNNIMRIIEDENERQKMGAKARENVQRFLPDKITADWHRFFLTLKGEQ